MNTTSTPTTSRTRAARVFGIFAAATLGVTGLAMPATAAEGAHGADSWRDGVVLDTSAAYSDFSTAFSSDGLVCSSGKDGMAYGTEIEIAKVDQNGAPIEGVEFSVTAALNPEFGEVSGGFGAVVDLASWEQTRDRDLEQARLDALDARTAANDDYLAALEVQRDADTAAAEAQTALEEARDTLNGGTERTEARLALAGAEAWAITVEEAVVDPAWAVVGDEAAIRAQLEEDRINRGILTVEEAEAALEAVEAEIEAELAPLQEAADEAQEAADEAAGVSDELLAVYQAANIVHGDAAVALSEHIWANASTNDWIIETDEDGVASIELVGCAVTGGPTATGGMPGITVTEISVPEGIDPAGVGESVQFDRKGVLLDGEFNRIDAFDSPVFTGFEAAAIEKDLGDAITAIDYEIDITAVNTREPEEPETPEEPPVETPPVTTPPTEEPEEPETPEEPGTPSTPVPPTKSPDVPTYAPPVVSG